MKQTAKLLTDKNDQLSSKPTTWDGFFEALKDCHVPADFLSKKERKQKAQDRDPFEGIEEEIEE